MIARILVPILIIIIFSDLYIDRRFLRRRTRYLWWQRVLWWMPGVLLIAYTLIVALSKHFAPSCMTVLNVYLLLLGVVVLPKFVFAFCSLLGWGHCRFHHTRNNWGNLVGFFLAIAVIIIVVYGSTFGFRKLVVRHVVFRSADLPEAFNGYKIVHFSDAHVGIYGDGDTALLEEFVDSINAQKPDLILFTGDLQNMEPKELYPVIPLLSSLKAADGVFSVLGNHDYADYIKAEDAVKVANERELISRERQFGWNLLLNENRSVKRGNDSIVIAGMENDGRPPFPRKGDIRKTLAGVADSAFVIMLEHDPTAWRRMILPQSRAQLTLSGHTHAMQFSIFGFSPAAFIYDEWGGMYYEGKRALNVSVGMGGFIPFRFGASNEIVVIELRK